MTASEALARLRSGNAAYSMLPSWWLSMTLPATRITKSSPMPASKIASGITRESEHAITIA